MPCSTEVATWALPAAIVTTARATATRATSLGRRRVNPSDTMPKIDVVQRCSITDVRTGLDPPGAGGQVMRSLRLHPGEAALTTRHSLAHPDGMPGR